MFQTHTLFLTFFLRVQTHTLLPSPLGDAGVVTEPHFQPLPLLLLEDSTQPQRDVFYTFFPLPPTLRVVA